jgi:hypothetical protein
VGRPCRRKSKTLEEDFEDVTATKLSECEEKKKPLII